MTAFRDGRVTLRKNRRTDGYTEALKEHGYQHVRTGDLVVHSMDGFAGAIGVSDSDGKMSPVANIYLADGDARYFAYTLRVLAWGGLVTALAKGIRERSTSFDAPTIASLVLPRPSVDEQRRIADFLDDRVARIDQIITARRRQQTFAKEELQAALETEFWAGGDRMPLKHLLSSVTSGPRGWGDLVRDEGTPFVRIGNLRPLGIELLPVNLAKVEMPTDAEAHRASLMSGDVLLSITAAFGEVAVWRGGCGTFSQHVARLRPLSTADSDWVGWALQTHSVHDQYSMLAYGGTKIGMGLDQVRNLHVPRLQPRDRAKVAARMADAWQVFSAGQSAFERSVRLFLEYKQSLITAAVTGELDVTTAGSGIPG